MHPTKFRRFWGSSGLWFPLCSISGIHLIFCRPFVFCSRGGLIKQVEGIILVDDDGAVGVSSGKGSSHYSCASSVTDEEGISIRAPGVVARLMGLDSVPTSGDLWSCELKRC
ncbi:uncharacterized protein LOC109851080 isoform X2 [Asparagus officinalis]|uniref:uncharacterized protein LOC109851080 isoform X2 n=1 Tax=Asparagus officinalis TaxID=4686 RepID=UPI00098E0D0C|nr:uncharacterized protein LOC109851080 isoform X2 [Asparagus officinalis]